MKEGDCAGALPLLERSHASEPTVGTQFNMAICESRLGLLTRAKEHLQSVIEASAPGDDRRVHAERALLELLPRIPYLVLDLDSARHTVELVRLDGQTPSELRPNEPFAINPGPHELEVVLRGETPQLRRFNVLERQVYTWSLGGVGATRAVEPTVAPSTAPPRDSAEPEPREPTTWTEGRIVAAVAAGTSVVAFGVATGFAINARSTYAESEADCDANDICGPDGMEARELAHKQGNAATIAAAVGVAAAAGAVALWFIAAPRSSDGARSVQVGVRANGWAGSLRGGGIVVEGSY
jgi:hypothetical protein